MPSASWVLITGANRGLGYVTAKKLVNDGESVIVGARSKASADDAVARLAEETGHPERLAALAVDISNPKSVEVAAWTLGLDFAGKLGGLINNAAVITTEVTEDEWKRLWATNVAGTFNFSKRLAPLINEGGHIVHVGSMLGQLDGIPLDGVKAYIAGAKTLRELIDMPYPAEELAKITGPRDSFELMYLLYCISKAAVLHGTILEAAEPRLTSRHITIVTSCPGWCRTEMGGGMAPRSAEDGARAIAWGYLSPKARASNGGFFQDNRPLSITEVFADRAGPALWAEE